MLFSIKNYHIKNVCLILDVIAIKAKVAGEIPEIMYAQNDVQGH